MDLDDRLNWCKEQLKSCPEREPESYTDEEIKAHDSAMERMIAKLYKKFDCNPIFFEINAKTKTLRKTLNISLDLEEHIFEGLCGYFGYIPRDQAYDGEYLKIISDSLDKNFHDLDDFEGFIKNMSYFIRSITGYQTFIELMYGERPKKAQLLFYGYLFRSIFPLMKKHNNMINIDFEIRKGAHAKIEKIFRESRKIEYDCEKSKSTFEQFIKPLDEYLNSLCAKYARYHSQ